MVSRVALALVLEVLRRQADRRHRKDLRVVADLGPAVDRRPTRRSGSARRCARPGRSRSAGRSIVPAPIARRRDARCAVGSTYAAPGSTASSSSASATTLVVDVAPPPAPCASRDRAAPSVTSSRSRSPGTTWRRNLALLTPRSDTRAVGGASGAIEDAAPPPPASAPRSSARAGISGEPGKVALEELLVDGDVLDRHEPAARLVLGDRVDRATRDSGSRRGRGARGGRGRRRMTSRAVTSVRHGAPTRRRTRAGPAAGSRGPARDLRRRRGRLGRRGCGRRPPPPAASNAWMTSVVRSMRRIGPDQPAVGGVEDNVHRFSLATLSMTGVSLRWNSSWSCCGSSWTSCCASSVKRWMSRCCRSMSVCSCARAASLSTLPPDRASAAPPAAPCSSRSAR